MNTLDVLPNTSELPFRLVDEQKINVAYAYYEDHARLFAAAPDLLEALVKAEHMLRLKGYTPAVLEIHGISTAIAKAKSE